MKKVLIVDDSRFVYEELKLMLADAEEYQIAGYARTGEEALEVYEEVQPDIVTMDIILPGMDGMETTRHILERWPEAKVLMVSSLAYDDTIEESKKSGAAEFIYKPFDKEKLIGMLDKVLSS